MTGVERYVVEIRSRPDGDLSTMVVETPFGQFKAGAVAALALHAEDSSVHVGSITVSECAPDRGTDPKQTIVDPWKDLNSE